MQFPSYCPHSDGIDDVSANLVTISPFSRYVCESPMDFVHIVLEKTQASESGSPTPNSDSTSP